MDKKQNIKIPFKQRCAQSRVGFILTMVGVWLTFILMIPMMGNIGFGALSLLIVMIFTSWPIATVGLVLQLKGNKIDIARYNKAHGNESIDPAKTESIPVKEEPKPVQENTATIQEAPAPIIKEKVESEEERIQRLEKEKESKYNKALECFANRNYKEALKFFKALDSYKDSHNKAIECQSFIDEAKAKNKKKAISVICVLAGVVVLSIGGVITIKTINKNKMTGNGSIDNPYQIKNVDQLLKANKADAYYQLAGSFDLTDSDLKANLDVNYHLDGNGQSLTYIGKEISPLFDNIGEFGSISNLFINLEQKDITMSDKKDYSLAIGTNNGAINNVSINVTFTGKYEGVSTGDEYPKLASINVNNGTISDSRFSPNCKLDINHKYIEVAGVCNENNGNIDNCTSYSDIIAPGACGYANINTGTINNSTSGGFITGVEALNNVDVLSAGFSIFNMSSGSITNSTTDAVCTAKCGNGYHGYASGIAFSNEGLIKNSKATSEVCITGNSNDSSNIFMASAGICAYNYKNIDSCTFTGILKAYDTSSSAICLGGICAQNSPAGNISNCKYVPAYSNPIRINNSNGLVYVAGILVYNEGSVSGCSCSISSPQGATYYSQIVLLVG